MNPWAFAALPLVDERHPFVSAGWRPAAALLIGLMSSACSAQEGASTTPSVAAPTTTQTPSPSAEPTRRPLPTAGAFPGSLVAGLQTETDVPFTQSLPCGSGECEIPLDVLAPEAGEALPTIVLLPGGPGAFQDRRYLEGLAAAVAARGAVVYLATYRSEATTNSTEDAMHDVRCAIRFARSTTSDYGGDPDRVVLIGHSFGSGLALQTAVEAEADTPGCLADESGIPTAVVGLAGFGFSITGEPESQPPILLVSGSEDGAAGFGESAAVELVAAGFEAEYVELDGIDHFEIVDPGEAPSVLDMIFDAASPAG